MQIEYLNGGDHRWIGYTDTFLSEANPEKAAKQFDISYRHGGGWRPMAKWAFDPKKQTLKYPGDPAYKPKARITFREELILVYDHAWFCIVQPDGSFEVSRMD